MKNAAEALIKATRKSEGEKSCCKKNTGREIRDWNWREANTKQLSFYTEPGKQAWKQTGERNVSENH